MAAPWITLATWLFLLSGVPLLLLALYFVLVQQWVRWLGRPALATVLRAEHVGTLPRVVTQVTLQMQPDGRTGLCAHPEVARSSERIAHPDQLTPGAQLRMRYRLARHSIVMPDARIRQVVYRA